MLMLSIPTVTISATGATVPSSVGKAVAIDGNRNEAEGWGSTPIAYLDKIYSNSTMSEGEARGEVYVTADKEYVYIFFELYREYNVVFDSATTQTFLKVYFGDAGEYEIGCWGTSKGKKRNNFSEKKANNPHWPTDVTGTFSGMALNDREDGCYTVECKLPIPKSVQKQTDTATVEVKISVAQGLDGIGGGYISETAIVGANESTARNAKDNGIAVTLPQIAPEDVPPPDEMPVVENVAGRTVTIDGRMSAEEGWAAIPYALLDTAGFGADLSDVTVDSKVYFSTDGQNLYMFFKSGAEKHGEDPLLYLNLCFKGFEKNLEIVVQMLEGKTGFWRWRCNDTAQTEYTNQAKLNAAQATVIAENETTVELRIPLPDSEKSAMLDGETNIKFGIFERYNSKSGDAGASPSEGFGWNANISMKLPMVEVRNIGIHSRINPDNADKRDVRFLAVIGNYADYEELGFHLVLNGEREATVNSYIVYSAINAGDQQIYAENYGGKYFFAYTLTGLEKGAVYTFGVTAFAKKANAEVVRSSKYTVTVTVNAEGIVSFS